MMSALILLACSMLQVTPAPAVAIVPARDLEADRKAATLALEQIIKSYRDELGVTAQLEVTVSAADGTGAAGAAPSIKMKCVFGSGRRALLSLRDYQLRLDGGRIVATHDSNPLAYLDVSDQGSPYYALFNAFRSLPFPELALALGENAPDEVCMQLMPQIPDVIPLRVDDDEIDGQACKVLVLQSDDASQELKLFFDPETKLIETSIGIKRGAPDVEPGAALQWKVQSKSSRPKEKPTDKTFAFDSIGKQKVDGLAALIVRDPGAAEDRDVAALKAGEPAPALALPKVGGGEWDLLSARPKPVLVDFWATWCGPCVGALPSLAKIAAEFEGKVVVMMVNSGDQGSREERETKIKKVFADRKVALSSVMDLDGQAARRWLVRAFPSTFIVAPDGKIAGVWVGNSPRNEREIHEKLKELCGEAAAPAPAPAPAPDPAPAPAPANG